MISRIMYFSSSKYTSSSFSLGHFWTHHLTTDWNVWEYAKDSLFRHSQWKCLIYSTRVGIIWMKLSNSMICRLLSQQIVQSPSKEDDFRVHEMHCILMCLVLYWKYVFLMVITRKTGFEEYKKPKQLKCYTFTQCIKCCFVNKYIESIKGSLSIRLQYAIIDSLLHSILQNMLMPIIPIHCGENHAIGMHFNCDMNLSLYVFALTHGEIPKSTALRM